jgi:hypothetical protein
MWTPVLNEDIWLQIQGELSDILALQENTPPGLALLQEQLRTLQLEPNADNGTVITDNKSRHHDDMRYTSRRFFL